MISEEVNRDPVETGLADQLNQVIRYEHASGAQRFLNYLVDNLLMQFGLSYLTGMIVGFLIAKMAPDFAYRIAYEGTTQGDLLLISFLIGIFNYVVYYTFCEKVFKGYTLGKLLTGTRAIREDGSELTFKDAILRSLSRLVPFEPFSGFGPRPWHDSWTNTVVVKSR
jgi:uncharacterized RDD family membrane protein YckC